MVKLMQASTTTQSRKAGKYYVLNLFDKSFAGPLGTKADAKIVRSQLRSTTKADDFLEVGTNIIIIQASDKGKYPDFKSLNQKCQNCNKQPARLCSATGNSDFCSDICEGEFTHDDDLIALGENERETAKHQHAESGKLYNCKRSNCEKGA